MAAIPEGAVCDVLTGDRLASVFPDAGAEKLSAIARELDLRIVSGQLDTRERLIHFLAQMRQESGEDARLEENLYYRPQRLRGIYGYFRDNPDEADRLGRMDDHPADLVAIANLAHANRNGNGDAASCDGWAYRGGGLFQLTGRANYREFTDSLEKLLIFAQYFRDVVDCGDMGDGRHQAALAQGAAKGAQFQGSSSSRRLIL